MNRIKELRKEKSLSQKELADMLGVAQNTVSQWESGKRTLDTDTLLLLSSYFHVSTDYILDRETKPSSSGVRIKVYGSVPAGIPIEAVEDIIDWEEIPREWTLHQQEYIALQVKGDSMWPDYREGDIVIIRLQPDCESGQDAVVYVNGYEATLKKVIKNDLGVILQPLNAAYEPLIYSKQQIQELPLKILGIVVELRRKIR